MAAIGGILQRDGRAVEEGELRRLTGAMARRGGDGGGHWVEGSLGLLHLGFHSTPESLAEQQPLIGGGGRWVLVADARLDNREELLHALGGRAAFGEGVVSDAELLLAASLRWGREAATHLLGDFVYALWDREQRELLLVRDPLGGYSLSYRQQGEAFYFASETSALLALPHGSPELEEETILRTLAMLTPSAEQTFFRGLRYLPPAHALLISSRGERLWRYWQVDGERRIAYRSDGEYVEQFLALLNQATAARLRSTGAVGISLSGGYDSTLLAACAAPLLPQRVAAWPRLHSFSYVFDQHTLCDERLYSDPVVAQYGLEGHSLLADEAWSFADLGTAPVARDFLWTNCYAQLPRRVAAAAQEQGCRLLLDGHFGDTLCSGYSYVVADLLQRGEWRRLLTLLGGVRGGLRRLPALFHFGVRPLLPRGARRFYRRLRPLEVALPWLAAARRHQLAALVAQIDHEVQARCEGVAASRRPRCASLLNPSWPNGMAAVRGFLYAGYGLEKVSPYFDRRLVEFMLAIPAEQIAHPGRYRWLQQRAMQRLLLPAQVWQRTTKTSYESLLREGMERRERQRILALLQRPRAVAEGWIDGEWLRGQLAQPQWSDERLYTLSMIVHLELWLEAL